MRGQCRVSPPGAAAWPAGPLPELAREEVEHHPVADERERRIVARPLVAHERVLAVVLVPREGGARLAHPRVDLRAPLGRDVRVLAPPDHEHLAADLPRAREAVVAAEAEAALVDVGGVEAHAREHLRVHRRAEREVPADADAHHAELARWPSLACLVGLWCVARKLESSSWMERFSRQRSPSSLRFAVWNAMRPSRCVRRYRRHCRRGRDSDRRNHHGPC